MKAKELATMSTGELQEKLQELYVTIRKDRAQSATGTPPKNTLATYNNKKIIAKILTILNKKEETKKQEKT